MGIYERLPKDLGDFLFIPLPSLFIYLFPTPLNKTLENSIFTYLSLAWKGSEKIKLRESKKIAQTPKLRPLKTQYTFKHVCYFSGSGEPSSPWNSLHKSTPILIHIYRE